MQLCVAYENWCGHVIDLHKTYKKWHVERAKHTPVDPMCCCCCRYRAQKIAFPIKNKCVSSLDARWANCTPWWWWRFDLNWQQLSGKAIAADKTIGQLIGLRASRSFAFNLLDDAHLNWCENPPPGCVWTRRRWQTNAQARYLGRGIYYRGLCCRLAVWLSVYKEMPFPRTGNAQNT